MTDYLPGRSGFETGYAQSKTQLVYTTLVNDLDTPVSAFAKLSEGQEYSCLLESVEGGEQRGRYSIIAIDPDLVWICEKGEVKAAKGLDAVENNMFQTINTPPLEALKSLIANVAVDIPKDLPPMAAGLFGYLGYDMIRYYEDIGPVMADPIGTPDSILIRPTLIAIFDSLKQEFILATPVSRDENISADAAYDAACARLDAGTQTLLSGSRPHNYGIGTRKNIEPQHTIAPADFHARVRKAKEYILAGDVFQVVVGQRYSAKIESSPLSVYRALRRLNPSPFLYLLNLGDFSIVGSSPEILVRLRDKKVTLRPLAGSRPRGKTPEEDIALEQELLADKKERAEHLMLLDLGRNDVGRVCKPGSVKVTEEFVVERYSHIMHIVSNVEGEIADDQNAISAMFAGFPAGTVSGAPKVRAMQIIDELEMEKRGIYAGAVGYISAGGELDTAIALRTAVIKDGVMHVRAGAGLVLDSDPEMERQETLHKAMALFKAAGEAARYEP